MVMGVHMCAGQAGLLFALRLCVEGAGGTVPAGVAPPHGASPGRFVPGGVRGIAGHHCPHGSPCLGHLGLLAQPAAAVLDAGGRMFVRRHGPAAHHVPAQSVPAALGALERRDSYRRQRRSVGDVALDAARASDGTPHVPRRLHDLLCGAR